MIQHIVLFTPKATLTEEERRSFASTTIRTLTSSPDIARMSIGRRTRVDAGYERSFGDKTYNFAVVLDFNDRAALVRYLNSSDHAELGRLFWQNCQDTVICEVDVVDATGVDVVDRLV
ncbi:MAG: Dabb family protein [Acidobacteria bacterium]|nr:Dabb family protein [Acidobacteriota bacterium]